MAVVSVFIPCNATHMMSTHREVDTDRVPYSSLNRPMLVFSRGLSTNL